MPSWLGADWRITSVRRIEQEVVVAQLDPADVAAGETHLALFPGDLFIEVIGPDAVEEEIFATGVPAKEERVRLAARATVPLLLTEPFFTTPSGEWQIKDVARSELPAPEPVRPAPAPAPSPAPQIIVRERLPGYLPWVAGGVGLIALAVIASASSDAGGTKRAKR